MDENVDPVYQIQLLQREPNLIVWAVGDEGAPPKAIANKQQQLKQATMIRYLMDDLGSKPYDSDYTAVTTWLMVVESI